MKNGFFRIDREMIDDYILNDRPFCKLGFFTYLCSIAIYKPQFRSFNERDIWLEKGDVAISLRNLEKVTGWNKNRTARYLKRLEKRDTIDIKTRTPVTVISIRYLREKDETEMVMRDSDDTANGTATGQRRDSDGTQPNKEKKVIKKKDLVGAKNAPPSKDSFFQKLNSLDFGCWPVQPSEEQKVIWYQNRKKKKIPITQSIVDRHGARLRECEKLGYRVEKCLEIFLDNGWQSPELRYFEQYPDIKSSLSSPYRKDEFYKPVQYDKKKAQNSEGAKKGHVLIGNILNKLNEGKYE